MKMVLGAVFAAAAVLVAWMAGTGRQLPFGIAAGAAVWWVLGLGMTACALGGIGDVLGRVGGDWTSPWMLAGMASGVVALAVVWAAASGSTLGIVSDSRQWLLVLAGIIGVKVVVASVQAVLAASAVAART